MTTDRWRKGRPSVTTNLRKCEAVTYNEHGDPVKCAGPAHWVTSEAHGKSYLLCAEHAGMFSEIVQPIAIAVSSQDGHSLRDTGSNGAQP